MKIETKFDIGEKVFLIVDGKIQEKEITNLFISMNIGEIYEKYNQGGLRFQYELGKYLEFIPENKLFKTKEELISSL